jgi:hypothetical protein
MMSNFLKSAAIAVTAAAIAFSGAAPASACARHNNNSAVSFSVGSAAFGYRDGYWDNGQTWHNWRNNRDYRSYRGRQGSSYHNWNHTHDANNGWQR